MLCPLPSRAGIRVTVFLSAKDAENAQAVGHDGDHQRSICLLLALSFVADTSFVFACGNARSARHFRRDRRRARVGDPDLAAADRDAVFQCHPECTNRGCDRTGWRLAEGQSGGDQ